MKNEFENHLKDILHRSQCPSSMEFGEYHLKLLDTSRQLIIAAHLRACRFCRKEMTDLTAFMEPSTAKVQQQEKLQSEPLRQLRSIIIDLLSPSPQIVVPQTAPVAVRGENDLITRAYTIENYLITMSMPAHGSGEQIEITGDVTNIDNPGETFTAWSCALLQQGEQIASGSLDEFGHFLLAGSVVTSAPCELVLTGFAVEILFNNLYR